jgi:hypothetical protein
VTDAIVYYAYGYITLVVFLFVGAAVYGYRVTRITGTFRGWLLLIGAIALAAASSVFTYFQILFFESFAQVTAIVEASTPLNFLLGSFYEIALALMLFFGMFELFRIFNKPATTTETENETHADILQEESTTSDAVE